MSTISSDLLARIEALRADLQTVADLPAPARALADQRLADARSAIQRGLSADRLAELWRYSGHAADTETDTD